MSNTEKIIDDKETCDWTLDNSDWYCYETSCQQCFVMSDGDLKDNGINYCCYCGKPVSEIKEGATMTKLKKYDPKYRIGQKVKFKTSGAEAYVLGVQCAQSSDQWEVVYLLSDGPVHPSTTNTAINQKFPEDNLLSETEYHLYVTKKAIDHLKSFGFLIECNGIQLDDKNYTGCSGSHGDCPVCGN